MNNRIYLGDCLDILPTLPDKFVRLAYIDSPFSTGKVQKRTRIHVRAAEDGQGDRVGFGGRSYHTTTQDSPEFADSFEDFPSFLMPRIEAALHTLTDDGVLVVHLDYREVHYIKVALDKLLGRDKFLNEIIWSYDYGARSKKKWPAKHDNLLVYVMDPKHYVFNYEAMDRLPYLAPDLVGPEKAARGKTPTDVWQMTIVPTNSKEKQNYPTQKPLHLLNRLIKIHSNEGDTVLDFFAGSGTTGASAALHHRHFCLIDSNPDAVNIMERRLANYSPEVIRG